MFSRLAVLNPTSQSGSMNLSSTYFKIWIGEELVLDWVPMRRVADGVEGFWDNVTNTFVERL